MATTTLALTSCASLPFSGNANHYADSRSSGLAAEGEITPAGPADGASPEEIIRGFLRAGIGANDDYLVARQYLTAQKAQSWRPDTQALVYADSLLIQQGQEQSKYKVEVPVGTQVNSLGLATSFARTNSMDLEFTLEEVNGQWRISELPDGVVLEQSEFEQSFSAFSLYFYDQTFTYAVPDIRWFADRASVATSLVRVLIAGPAPYLQGAVRSAIPDNSSLTRNSVPIENNNAQVSLSGTGISNDMSQLDIERIHTQLKQTLTRISGIENISLELGQQQAKVGQLENYIEPQLDPVVAKNVVGIDGNELTVRSELLNDESKNFVFSSTHGSMTNLAMSYNRQSFAFLDPQRSQLTVVRGGQSRLAFEGQGLTSPSYDQFQWLWSATEEGKIRAVSVANSSSIQPIDISASWLEGAKVLSLKVARDGARVAIVAESDGNSYLWVSGVNRNSENRPQSLTQPVRVGASISAQFAAWVSDQGLIAANFDTGESELAQLSGELTSLGYLDSLEQLSSCIGADQVVAQTAQQNIYLLVDRGWSRVETTAHDFSFSG
ncbi:MAG: LpqB family beta-propeller domain-containing protein [Rothia sp. (in: high G+C Gram-positive bacteria)]|nr:LpqB family beta-propeller domain-containing protein [Rothia sp. (in: high G+C Gram-positive bacteria)]